MKVYSLEADPSSLSPFVEFKGLEVLCPFKAGAMLKFAKLSEPADASASPSFGLMSVKFGSEESLAVKDVKGTAPLSNALLVMPYVKGYYPIVKVLVGSEQYYSATCLAVDGNADVKYTLAPPYPSGWSVKDVTFVGEEEVKPQGSLQIVVNVPGVAVSPKKADAKDVDGKALVFGKARVPFGYVKGELPKAVPQLSLYRGGAEVHYFAKAEDAEGAAVLV